MYIMNLQEHLVILLGLRNIIQENMVKKKYKCEKCSKKYAVQSDWKAHTKTCGTREYRCDCGTLFSRRDSFITHRAFCDALAQESARNPPSLSGIGSHLYGSSNNNNISLGGLSKLNSQISDHHEMLHFGGSNNNNNNNNGAHHHHHQNQLITITTTTSLARQLFVLQLPFSNFQLIKQVIKITG